MRVPQCMEASISSARLSVCVAMACIVAKEFFTRCFISFTSNCCCACARLRSEMSLAILETSANRRFGASRQLEASSWSRRRKPHSV
jgi:hypothetical protein